MEKIKIGISIGDINGIGPEVLLKTLGDSRITELCTPVIFGSAKILAYHKNIVKLRSFQFHTIEEGEQPEEGQINVVNCWSDNVRINLGNISEEAGKYAYIALEKAVQALKDGYVDALVTAPINKEAMQLANFPHTGHTEYLAEQLGSKENLMMLVHENLRVGLVTNHLPIRQVADAINSQTVLRKLQLMHHSLRADFGLDRPKIAVLGLNPHASDGGNIGKEEQEVILPAIEKAKKEGIMAIGPYPADGFFGSQNYKNFDAILAMYHDQGLVAFKALSFGQGVNFTAGMPFVRTSPDHGTAFNLAGKNVAEADSFRRALYLAIDAYRNRANYEDMHANEMPIISLEQYEKEEEQERRKYRKQRQQERKDAPKQEETNEEDPKGKGKRSSKRPPRGPKRKGPRPTDAVENKEAEAPKNEQKQEPQKQEPKAEAPKNEQKQEPKKQEPKAEAPKNEQKQEPKKQEPKAEAPKNEQKQEPKKQEPKAEAPKNEQKQEPQKQEPKAEAPKNEQKQEPKKQEPKAEAPKNEQKQEPKKQEPKAEAPQSELKQEELNKD
ncbi:4-hydroxythreonine-4-phosphate dehydrogenase PdxA [Saprospira grandis]|uniref:4-hydroxythreonine-4-phosphate dehydrogenase PdxA n=1 Tax=Saprospira grandis TaxID=1008 RepID=UPI0022DD86A1|nr:4-hydroxythreonine-4-phosphate dehydrogenase PdxA [Saprospira grandis]WBM73144.1 4-hydroxythreonine-4-phosphate dehydrogenase PdxA [Saprospira grandis]